MAASKKRSKAAAGPSGIRPTKPAPKPPRPPAPQQKRPASDPIHLLMAVELRKLRDLASRKFGVKGVRALVFAMRELAAEYATPSSEPLRTPLAEEPTMHDPQATRIDDQTAGKIESLLQDLVNLSRGKHQGIVNAYLGREKRGSAQRKPRRAGLQKRQGRKKARPKLKS